MEKIRLGNYISYTAIFFITVCVIMYGYPISQGMKHAVETCLNTMIPSLYAMMICSTLFLSSGLHRILSRFLNAPARIIFGCSGDVLVIFLLSQTAGYPVGAKMLCTLSRNGQLTKKQASWLAGVCFGGGPAFLSALFAGKNQFTAAVFLSCLASNVILFALISRFLHVKTSPAAFSSGRALSSSDIVEAVSGSGTALLRICTMVIMFGGITGLAEAAGLFSSIPENIKKIIISIWEISHVTAFIPCRHSELPILGALLSFGGICVLMQVAAVSEGRLNILCILLLRIISAGLTWLFLHMITLGFLREDALEAAVIWQPPSDIQYGSPFPSLLLLLMTIMLLKTAKT